MEEYLRFIYLKDGTDGNTPNMSDFRKASNNYSSLFRDKGVGADVGTTAGVTYVTNGGNYETTYASTGCQTARLAMWVRFSDADSIATATANELAAWKAEGGAMDTAMSLVKNKSSVTLDGRDFKVLEVQGCKALITLANFTDNSEGLYMEGYQYYKQDGTSTFYDDNCEAKKRVDAWYAKLPEDGDIRPYAYVANIGAGAASCANVRTWAGAKAGTQTKTVAFLATREDVRIVMETPNQRYITGWGTNGSNWWCARSAETENTMTSISNLGTFQLNQPNVKTAQQVLRPFIWVDVAAFG